MMKNILLKSFFILILTAAVLILPIFYPTGIFVYIRLILLLLILIEISVLFKTVIIDKQINKFTANLATVCFSVLAILILLEAIFMFIPRSHGVNHTLASKLWYAKYWKPVNSLGLRDSEPKDKNHVILFIGDSYTAGSGLKSAEDRFSNIIGRELNKKNKKFTVINIGKFNLDSRDEYKLMRDFFYLTRIKPEIIVLQYYGNDIGGVAIDSGMKFSCFNPLKIDKFLIISSMSYLFNYIYYLFPDQSSYNQYISCLSQAYRNKDILFKHKEDLLLFVNYARENSVKLIVVIFPFLNELEISDSMYGNIISDFFRANHVSTVNVSGLIKNLPVSERIVNKSDLHASKIVNEMVAREILKILD